MLTDPPMTLRGALRILDVHDHKYLESISMLAGAAIIVAPSAALLGPAAGIAAAWGWVDQKNELVSILKRVTAKFITHALRTNGHERQKLIVAAHTTIVISAYFETLREHLRTTHKDPKLSRADQARLSRAWRRQGASLVDALYDSNIPTPSAACGFRENRDALQSWYVDLNRRTVRFLSGLAAWEDIQYGDDWSHSIAVSADSRYASHFLELAARSTEFYVWHALNEHSATRHQLRTNADIHNALQQDSQRAFARLEALLTLNESRAQSANEQLLQELDNVNSSYLTEQIVPISSQVQDEDIIFPRIVDCYLTPRYRLAAFDRRSSRPWDETWWEGHRVYDDLDFRLMAQLYGTSGHTTPLLILGHPGAGKSLLSKVLAARLPRTSYTSIVVQLRNVGSNDPVYSQVADGLTLATNGRITWPQLSRASGHTLRVLILDGLDELLQASTVQRDGYLLEVADFQRSEAAQDRPVVVIVTSRTVVADRVRIPDGTPVVRLEEFNNTQASRWLTVWNDANIRAASKGHFRPLTPEVATRYEYLTRQPLLLMILALYSADPSSPALDENISTASLYSQIVHRFALREVIRGGQIGRNIEIDSLIEEHLWRLSIAALGMFNRGSQNITEADLGADLEALDERSSGTSRLEMGKRTIAAFFFVHTAEAQTDAARTPGRSFEYMHATFGEYFVARQTLEELNKLATMNAILGKNQSLDNSFLFAIMGHEPIIHRWSIVEFSAEIVAGAEHESRLSMAQVLNLLIRESSRISKSRRFSEYNPTWPDVLRRTASYSANLVTLRILLEDDWRLPLEEIWMEDPLGEWTSTARLWHAKFRPESWQSVLGSISLEDSHLSLNSPKIVSPSREVAHARLTGDYRTELILRLGEGAWDSISSWNDGDDSSLVNRLASFYTQRNFASRDFRPKKQKSREVASEPWVADILRRALESPEAAADRDSLFSALQYVVSFLDPPPHDLDTIGWIRTLSTILQRHPQILSEIPALPALIRRLSGAR